MRRAFEVDLLEAQEVGIPQRPWSCEQIGRPVNVFAELHVEGHEPDLAGTTS